MSNIVQTFRSPTPNRLPSAGTRLAGELWVNFPDRQIGFVDAAQNAQPLVAVRYFSTLTAYGAGDFVTQAGGLYVAKSTVPAGPFVPAQWNQLATYVGGTFASLILNGPAGTARNLFSQTAGVNRWELQLAGASPESGSNAGSDFFIYRYNDAGAVIDAPMTINRATGAAAFTVKPSIPGYLQLSGGSLTGALGGTTAVFSGGVNTGNLGVAGTLALVANNTSLSFTDTGGTHPYFNCQGDNNFVFWGTNDSGASVPIWSSVQRVATPSLTVNSPCNMASSLDVQGALNGHGGAFVDLSANNSLSGGTVTYPCVVTAPGWYFTTSGNLNINNWQSGGWYDSFDRSNGTRLWASPSSILMSMDGSGNISLTGQLYAGANIVGTNAVIVRATGVNNSQFLMQDSQPVNRGILYYNASNGVIYLQNSIAGTTFNLDGAGNCTANTSSNGNFIASPGHGYQPGGGSWLAYSDERIKTVQSDYEVGLDAILALRPVVYTYKGNDTLTEHLVKGDPENSSMEYEGSTPYPASIHYQDAETQNTYVGLVAQEAETVIPGMVTRSEGYIDGEKVTDLRTLDNSELIYALVNAVKTLAARVTELEGASATR